MEGTGQLEKAEASFGERDSKGKKIVVQALSGRARAERQKLDCGRGQEQIGQ